MTGQQRFAVCVLQPEGYAHSQAFNEIAETVHFGLQSIGFDSILTDKPDTPGRRAIILGCNLITPYSIGLPADSILYNLEQVDLESPWFDLDVLRLFRQHDVWDYSRANIEQLSRLGIAAKHVPVGFVPQLQRVPLNGEKEKDIDVLFVGSVNMRRLVIINALKRRGVRVVCLCGVYGKTRDTYYSRSKIVLNVHFYEARVLELVRISFLLANSRFVVSEPGIDEAENGMFSDGLAFARYDRIVDTCIHFLARHDERRRIAERGHAVISGCPESDYLTTALQATTMIPTLDGGQHARYRL